MKQLNKQKLVLVISGLIAGSAGTIFFTTESWSIVINYFPPCLFHWLTGLNCPGCGLTRAVLQIIHGHILAALKLNPLLVLVIPIVIMLVLRRQCLMDRRVAWSLLVLLIIFGVSRNIPGWPSQLLGPN